MPDIGSRFALRRRSRYTVEPHVPQKWSDTLFSSLPAIPTPSISTPLQTFGSPKYAMTCARVPVCF